MRDVVWTQRPQPLFIAIGTLSQLVRSFVWTQSPQPLFIAIGSRTLNSKVFIQAWGPRHSQRREDVELTDALPLALNKKFGTRLELQINLCEMLCGRNVPNRCLSGLEL